MGTAIDCLPFGHIESEIIFRKERDSNAEPFRLNGVADEANGKQDFVQGSDLAETVLAELVVYAPGCDAK